MAAAALRAFVALFPPPDTRGRNATADLELYRQIVEEDRPIVEEKKNDRAPLRQISNRSEALQIRDGINGGQYKGHAARLPRAPDHPTGA
jgi:hypothetical protein